MSKYEAKGTFITGWLVLEVEGPAGAVIGMTDEGDAQLTEAEAQIIAFALNAIADGGRLGMKTDKWPEWATYTGPTEGV